jgi:hypothetical protein
LQGGSREATATVRSNAIAGTQTGKKKAEAGVHDWSFPPFGTGAQNQFVPVARLINNGLEGGERARSG